MITIKKSNNSAELFATTWQMYIPKINKESKLICASCGKEITEEVYVIARLDAKDLKGRRMFVTLHDCCKDDDTTCKNIYNLKLNSNSYED